MKIKISLINTKSRFFCAYRIIGNDDLAKDPKQKDKQNVKNFIFELNTQFLRAAV